MAQERFTALVVEQEGDGVRWALQELTSDALPEGDVLVRVLHSSLNYKDGLALNGKAKVIRRFPMIPGIDLAGTVVDSRSPEWKPGDAVIATGWGLGEQHWGGYTQLERLRAEWLVPVPENRDALWAMSLGSAGLTAMLSVMALEDSGISPDTGDIAVTGASGGVGSAAVALLAALGYRVVASTGRTELSDYLKRLGAVEVISRAVLAGSSTRPLESGRWAGAVDNVGGDTLAGLLRSMAPHGAIVSCGNAGGNALNTTVLPFILRGVRLLGIDSNYCPSPLRRAAWNRLDREMPNDVLESIVQREPLGRVPSLADEILQGDIRGRVVIDVTTV